MPLTTFEEFKELARRGTFVPVCKEVVADLLTPVSAFLKVAEHSDYAFLLESVEGGERVARYSFLGKDPFLVLRSRGGKTLLERAGETETLDEPFVDGAAPRDVRVAGALRARPAALHRRRGRLSSATTPRRGSSRRSRRAWQASRPLPEHEEDAGRLHGVRHGAGVRSREAPHPADRQRAHHPDEDLEALYQFACARIGFLETRTRARPRPSARRHAAAPLKVERQHRREPIRGSGRQAKEHIAAGDIYQVVLVAAVRRRSRGRPVHGLPGAPPRQPVALHVFHAAWAGSSVVGSSPEMLVRVEGRRVETHPIAGTRPRGAQRGRGPAARRGAEARREGTRRARHARRPRAQRPRSRLRLRHRARAAVHGARALLARHAPGVARRRPARRGPRSTRRAGVVLPGRHVSGAPKMRAMEIIAELERDRAATLRRRGRLPRLRRQPRLLHRHPHDHDARRRRPRAGGRRHRRRLEPGGRVRGDVQQGARAASARSNSRRRDCGSRDGPADRQLRFVHLQPRAVPRRAGRRGASSTQRRDHARRRSRRWRPTHRDLAGARPARGRGHLASR